MRIFLSLVSYLLHPLFIPIAGTIAYFLTTPKYSPLEVQAGNILPIFILTIVIPIITYLILKNIGVVNSIFMPTTEERKYPVVIHIILLLMVIYKVLPNNYLTELYYYFVGLLIAAFTCLLLLFLNFKTSIHLIGVSGLCMYLINLSIHFEINLIIAISIFTLLVGLVTSSRLYLKAHTHPEVAAGILIGVCSQLLTITYWL